MMLQKRWDEELDIFVDWINIHNLKIEEKYVRQKIKLCIWDSPDRANSFEIENNFIDYNNDHNIVNVWNNSDPQNKVIEVGNSGTSTPQEMSQKTKPYRENRGKKTMLLHMQ